MPYMTVCPHILRKFQTPVQIKGNLAWEKHRTGSVFAKYAGLCCYQVY